MRLASDPTSGVSGLDPGDIGIVSWRRRALRLVNESEP